MISYGPYIKSIIQKILILSKSEDIEEIREDRKVLSKTQSFGNAYIFLLNWERFMGQIRYLMKQFVNGESNI